MNTSWKSTQLQWGLSELEWHWGIGSLVFSNYCLLCLHCLHCLSWVAHSFGVWAILSTRKCWRVAYFARRMDDRSDRRAGATTGAKKGMWPCLITWSRELPRKKWEEQLWAGLLQHLMCLMHSLYFIKIIQFPLCLALWCELLWRGRIGPQVPP